MRIATVRTNKNVYETAAKGFSSSFSRVKSSSRSREVTLASLLISILQKGFSLFMLCFVRYGTFLFQKYKKNLRKASR